MKSHAIALLLLLIYFSSERRGVRARKVSLVVRSALCNRYNHILRIFECSFKPDPVVPNTFIYAGRMLYAQPIDKEFKLRLRLDIEKSGRRRKLRLMDATIDLCSGAAAIIPIIRQILLQPVVDELRRTSNFPNKCPVQADVLYQFNNFTASTAFFPSQTPAINFTLGLDFIYGRIMYASQVNEGSYSFK